MCLSHYNTLLDNSHFTVETPYHFTFYLNIIVFTTAMLLCFLSINDFSLLLHVYRNIYADSEYGSYQLIFLYTDYAYYHFSK